MVSYRWMLFLSGYITSDGVVTIGPNDVIYLYELRHVGNVGIDYQDVVMLVTFDSNPNCPAPVNQKVQEAVQVEKNMKPPCLIPIQPATNAVEVSTAQYAFRLKMDNVNAGEDISVTINGAPATGFNYNFTTEELTGNLNLVAGANVIGITAVNGDKSVTGSYTITYKPKNIVDPNTNTQRIRPVKSKQLLLRLLR
ncbi:MAG: hypothetical protein IPG07_03190 [Crocinitomicaceae bacterium]|nr:hypothetical protein [Crocinitomicaceae bacterium]